MEYDLQNPSLGQQPLDEEGEEEYFFPDFPIGPAYTNFAPHDPNTLTTGYEEELFVAISLDENGSKGISRGMWVDFSERKSPAIYKCCSTDFSTCPLLG